MGEYDMTTEEENLKNRIRFLEGELMVIREKARILTEISPFRIDEPTRQIAQDIVHCIDGIKENRE